MNPEPPALRIEPVHLTGSAFRKDHDCSGLPSKSSTLIESRSA